MQSTWPIIVSDLETPTDNTLHLGEVTWPVLSLFPHLVKGNTYASVVLKSRGLVQSLENTFCSRWDSTYFRLHGLYDLWGNYLILLSSWESNHAQYMDKRVRPRSNNVLLTKTDCELDLARGSRLLAPLLVSVPSCDPSQTSLVRASVEYYLPVFSASPLHMNFCHT